MGPVVERVLEGLQLGEGPHWDVETQSLYFVDIFAETICRYTPSTNTHTKAFIGKRVSFIIPVEKTSSQYVISMNHEVHLITWDGTSASISKSEKIVELDNQPHLEGNRINDAKADPMGRLWAGTVGPEPVNGQFVPDRGALYSISKARQVKKHVSDVHVSNGLAWSANMKKFYYIDTAKRRIDQFDFDVENEKIGNRQFLFTLEKHNLSGFPDGMTIDADDNLWVALFNGSCVIKIDSRNPETLLDTVKLPATQITSMVFGGPNLNELYVTTARVLDYGEDALSPGNGALYRITGLVAKGLPGVRVKL